MISSVENGEGLKKDFLDDIRYRKEGLAAVIDSVAVGSGDLETFKFQVVDQTLAALIAIMQAHPDKKGNSGLMPEHMELVKKATPMMQHFPAFNEAIEICAQEVNMLDRSSLPSGQVALLDEVSKEKGGELAFDRIMDLSIENSRTRHQDMGQRIREIRMEKNPDGYNPGPVRSSGLEGEIGGIAEKDNEVARGEKQRLIESITEATDLLRTFPLDDDTKAKNLLREKAAEAAAGIVGVPLGKHVPVEDVKGGLAESPYVSAKNVDVEQVGGFTASNIPGNTVSSKNGGMSRGAGAGPPRAGSVRTSNLEGEF